MLRAEIPWESDAAITPVPPISGGKNSSVSQ